MNIFLEGKRTGIVTKAISTHAKEREEAVQQLMH